MEIKFHGKNQFVIQNAKKNKIIFAQNPIDQISINENFEKNIIEFTEKNKNNLLIGYISYEVTNTIFSFKKEKTKHPIMQIFAFSSYSEGAVNLETPASSYKVYKNFTPTWDEQSYKNAYQKIKEYIELGHIYQINLTHRLEAKSDVPAALLYQKTIEKNQVEKAAYLDCGDFQIISASPELFITIAGNTITTSPIKGTINRSDDPTQDQQNLEILLASEKETAELNMITDLMRNDLSMVAKIGTVKVTKNRETQKCEKVWHTYSEIKGEIEELHPLIALFRLMPGGSISGCPKKRACEIIKELEPEKRGIYTGTIFHLLPNNTLNANIAIRTIIKEGDTLSLNVGGGIVYDSKEEAEYKETFQKAKSFMEIL